MRTETFKFVNIADSVAKYPDEVCFAFNPNFIEIESAWPAGVLTVVVQKISSSSAVDEQTIKVSMYMGRAKIYLSRLFELMFDDPQNQRCIEVSVTVKVASLNLFTFSTLVIWGNLALGERFGNIGVFNRTANKPYYERNLIWFKKFPFTVSLFRYNREVQFFGKFDGGVYSNEPIYQDTKVCFFEKLEKLAPDIPSLTSGTVSLPFEVVYYAQKKRFVVKKDGKFYGNWTGDENEFFGNTSDYCNSANDNKPLSNVTYLLETPTGYARYRFISDELVYCGMFSDLGFEDIPLNQVFPTAQRNATIKYRVSEEARLMSVFDNTFDYTFFQTGENLVLIKMQICNDTDGYYLRWIDRQGNLQYFLFRKGQIAYKNKLSSDVVVNDNPIGGMYFANHNRSRSIECSVTHKCCAVSLPDEIYDYVVTILTAPIVDLYIGVDNNGEAIWQPIQIQDGTVSYKNGNVLNDLEFSFAQPDINAQSL